MNEATYRSISESLGLELPAFYKFYMSAEDDDPRIQLLIEFQELENQDYGIIGANEDVRKSVGGWMQDDAPWPQEFFIFGHVESEFDSTFHDFWCINLELGKPQVWRYDYCGGLVAQAFDTFNDFLSVRAKYHAEQRELFEVEEERKEALMNELKIGFAEYLTRKYPNKTEHEPDLKEYLEYLCWRWGKNNPDEFDDE